MGIIVRALKTRKLLILVFSLVLLIGAGWLFLSARNPARLVQLSQIVERGQAANFNVLLITLDTTRPDHLGCYGYQDARTPGIDSLIQHGVRFDNAVTSVPTTLASHATILTGLYPPSTGVRDNGIHALKPEFVTFAEMLGDEGYDTAAFVSCFVLEERFGLDQGFDVYEFEPDRSSPKGPASLEHQRRADKVTDSAIGWLTSRHESHAQSPFFLWVHYYDPHHPYHPPAYPMPGLPDHPYDQEIAYMDVHLKRLLQTLDTHGMRDSTLIVLVSDHGEGLHEHDEALHGIFLYESTIRVALILSNPVLFSRPYRVDGGVVGTVDVLPTMLDLLGLTLPTKTDGQSLVRANPPPERAIYIETRYPLNLGCSELRGLRRKNDKYILAPWPEYYDLSEDPAELNNLYDVGNEDVQLLTKQFEDLRHRWSENDNTERAQRTLSSEEMRILQSLGYVGSGQHRNVEGLPDPKDRIHQVNRLDRVNRLLAAGQLEEALGQAKELADQTEGWAAPTLMAAEALLRLGRNEERAEVLARFCDKKPTAEMLFYLAHALLQLKQYEPCEQKLLAAEQLDPLFGAIPALRGDLYFAQQRYAEAAQQYEKAIQLDGQRLGSMVKINLREAKKRAGKDNP